MNSDILKKIGVIDIDDLSTEYQIVLERMLANNPGSFSRDIFIVFLKILKDNKDMRELIYELSGLLEETSKNVLILSKKHQALEQIVDSKLSTKH